MSAWEAASVQTRDYTFRGLTRSLCPHCRRLGLTFYQWVAVVLIVGPAGQW